MGVLVLLMASTTTSDNERGRYFQGRMECSGRNAGLGSLVHGPYWKEEKSCKV